MASAISRLTPTGARPATLLWMARITGLGARQGRLPAGGSRSFLLDQLGGRQREHVPALHARHLDEHFLGLAAPRRPDQHLDSNQPISPNRPPHERAGP
jgi:hypothetical protein